VIRTLIIGLFYTIAVSAIGIIGIPWTFITGDVTWLYRRAMWAAFTGVRLVGVNVTVKGKNVLDPQGTYIFMCNHVSNLDPPIVVPMIPGRTSVLVKKQVFRVPVLATAMYLADMIPVDRQNREAAIQSVKEAQRVMKSGVHMTIFPEGTRSPDGRLQPFKKGPFHLALETGFPVVPMTIYGSETLMPKSKWAILPGTVTLVFHAPIDPSQFNDRDAMAEKVFNQIASALPEHMKPIQTIQSL
jgi:1-acyl-sn-glycerol-3-phosphate acyltransferase